jgi:hypothetical protein
VCNACGCFVFVVADWLLITERASELNVYMHKSTSSLVLSLARIALGHCTTNTHSIKVSRCAHQRGDGRENQKLRLSAVNSCLPTVSERSACATYQLCGLQQRVNLSRNNRKKEDNF